VVESAATELQGKITLSDLFKSWGVMLLCSLFYAPEAQKAELDQSLFRKFKN